MFLLLQVLSLPKSSTDDKIAFSLSTVLGQFVYVLLVNGGLS